MGGKITGGKEFDWWYAKSIAEEVKEELLKAGVPKVEIAGSIRRKKGTVHDVDIVAFGDSEDYKDPLYKYCIEKFGVIQKVKKMEGFEKLKYPLPKRSGIIRDINVEIYPAVDKNWVVNLQTWTGPVSLNLRMRAMALKMGLSVSQKYGLIPTGCPDNPIMLDTEENLFRLLNMAYVRPEDRK